MLSKKSPPAKTLYCLMNSLICEATLEIGGEASVVVRRKPRQPRQQ